MCAGFATVTLGGAEALAIGNVADLQSTDSLPGPWGPAFLIWGSTEQQCGFDNSRKEAPQAPIKLFL